MPPQYPKWKYSRTKPEGVVVQDPEEEAKLGAGWYDNPAHIPAVDPVLVPPERFVQQAEGLLKPSGWSESPPLAPGDTVTVQPPTPPDEPNPGTEPDPEPAPKRGRGRPPGAKNKVKNDSPKSD
jgi:hypothetical protein